MVVHNPNNWHWVNKQCLDWSREWFDSKLTGVQAKDSLHTATISKVSKVEGDVEVSQRKGKVISLFDVQLTLAVECTGFGDTPVSATILVPELAYDSEFDSLQFEITLGNESGPAADARLFLRSNLIPQLRTILVQFGPELIATNSSDIQLEQDKVTSQFTKANQQSAAAKPTPVKKTVPVTASTPVQAAKALSYPNTPKYNTSTLKQDYVFQTSADQLYRTWLDPQRVAAFTRLEPVMSAFPPAPGSEYKLFGGSVEGQFLELVPDKRIVQLWRLLAWKAGHFAKFDITFDQGHGETKMHVDFSGIPIGEEEVVLDNFKSRYVDSIKRTFGFGILL